MRCKEYDYVLLVLLREDYLLLLFDSEFVQMVEEYYSL